MNHLFTVSLALALLPACGRTSLDGRKSAASAHDAPAAPKYCQACTGPGCAEPTVLTTTAGVTSHPAAGCPKTGLLGMCTFDSLSTAHATETAFFYETVYSLAADAQAQCLGLVAANVRWTPS